MVCSPLQSGQDLIWPRKRRVALPIHFLVFLPPSRYEISSDSHEVIPYKFIEPSFDFQRLIRCAPFPPRRGRKRRRFPSNDPLCFGLRSLRWNGLINVPPFYPQDSTKKPAASKSGGRSALPNAKKLYHEMQTLRGLRLVASSHYSTQQRGRFRACGKLRLWANRPTTMFGDVVRVIAPQSIVKGKPRKSGASKGQYSSARIIVSTRFVTSGSAGSGEPASMLWS